MGLILITHDLGVVARIADKVQVMYAGRTVEEGPVNAIFEEPAHPYTQGLLRCIPVPGKTKRGERLGSVPGIVPNLVGDLEGCMFRNRCPHATRRMRYGRRTAGQIVLWRSCPRLHPQPG